ncbi:MAG: DMT family transporter [Clostridia bacterium]|nr:DMT family transporter [Clostridia bacterium]
MKDKKQLFEHFLAFFTIFVWALTFICTKELQETFTSLEIVVIRYIIAYIVLWIIHPKKPVFYNLEDEAMIIIASIAGQSAYQFLENYSVEFTTPASVSFITALAPLFAAIFSHFILKTELTPRTIIGMLISIVGVGFVSFGDSRILDTGLKGDLIIFCTVWLWAVYSIIISVQASRGHNGVEVTRKLFFYSLVEMAIPVAFTCDVSRSDFTIKSIIGLVFLGIFASAICFYTWNRAVEKIGVVTTAKYLFVMPIITLIAQVILKVSEFSIIAVFGMALILLGLFVGEKRKD